MDYKAFALKYRPQIFDEMVGQDHVVSALKSAVLNNRVHHAYLFTGPRGIGKTSLARIMAKSLNCEQGPTVTPCGTCRSCTAVVKGTSLDVIEIDGASNRGIDEIRTLRENVKLSPTFSRFKIFIIDEVHMLTQEAFNALLKTLEEPPAHVKFIFATTHPHKVLPTILSRCQKFQFHLVPVEKMVEKMKKILAAEKMDIEEKYLYAIARSAGGSIRDAESLLDQIAPVLQERKDTIDVFSFLGIIEEETMNKMVAFTASRDFNAALEYVNKLVAEGKDLGVFLNNLIEHFKNMILFRLSPKAFKDLVYVSPQTKQFLAEQTRKISVRDILRLVDLLINAKDLGRKMNSVRIPFELALIKFCYKPEADPEPAASQTAAVSSVSASVPVKPAEAVPKPVKPAPAEQKPQIKKESPTALLGDWDDLGLEEDDVPVKSEPAKTGPESAESSAEIEQCEFAKIKEQWPRFIAEIKKVRMSLGCNLAEAELTALKSNVLRITFPKNLAFHKEVMERQKNQTFVIEMLEKFYQKPLGLKYLTSEKSSAPVIKPSAAEVSAADDADNEFINELLDTFEGTLDTSSDHE